MLKNIGLAQGRVMSEAVMIALVDKGVNRQEAHELLRRLTIRSEMDNRPLREVLLEDETVSKRLGKRGIDKALNPNNYVGTAMKQVDFIVEKTMRERKIRAL
jgi:adenylosuccinate lyase